MRTLLTMVIVGLLCATLAGAQERTASERYSNAIRKSAGLSPAAVRVVEEALEHGWPSGAAAETLNALLRVNSVSLTEVRRGALLPSCVLYPGRNVFDRSLDDVAMLGALTRLCGVHALHAMRQGDETQAVRDVVSMLGVGRQLAADRTMAVRELGLALVRQGCVTGTRLRTQAARAALADRLRGWVLPIAGDVPLAEKDVFLDAVEFASRELPKLRPRMLAHGPAVAAKFYDPMIIAFASGGAADRRAADEKVRALQRDLKKTYGELNLTRIVERGRAAHMPDDVVAEDLCRAVLCGVWPDFGAMPRPFQSAQAALDDLRRRAGR